MGWAEISMGKQDPSTKALEQGLLLWLERRHGVAAKYCINTVYYYFTLF
jgi:hypothetical protein